MYNHRTGYIHVNYLELVMSEVSLLLKAEVKRLEIEAGFYYFRLFQPNQLV